MNTIQVEYVCSTAAKTGLVREVSVSDYVVPTGRLLRCGRGFRVLKRFTIKLNAPMENLGRLQKEMFSSEVLGERKALKGYSGQVPRAALPGDTLHVLNLGGIIGTCYERPS